MIKKYRTAFAIISALAILAACGGSGDDSESSESSLHVIVSDQYDVLMIGAEAAESLGIFDEKNVDVNITRSEEGAKALASGDADISIGSPNRVIGAIDKGLEAKIVGPTADKWGQYIIVSKDLGVDSLEDWKGGRIGISSHGSAGDYSAEKVAETLGWNKDDYEKVTLGGLDSLMAGLRSGSIDGFMWSGQAAYTLQHEGVAKVLGNVGDVIGPNPIDVLTVAQDTIDNSPDEVKRFCESFYEAQKKFKDDPSVAESQFKKWDQDSPVMDDILDSGLAIISTDDKLSDEMLDNMAEATNYTIEDSEVTGDDVKGMYKQCSSL